MQFVGFCRSRLLTCLLITCEIVLHVRYSIFMWLGWEFVFQPNIVGTFVFFLCIGVDWGFGLVWLLYYMSLCGLSENLVMMLSSLGRYDEGSNWRRGLNSPLLGKNFGHPYSYYEGKVEPVLCWKRYRLEASGSGVSVLWSLMLSTAIFLVLMWCRLVQELFGIMVVVVVVCRPSVVECFFLLAGCFYFVWFVMFLFM